MIPQNNNNTPHSRGEDIIAGRNAVSEALKAGRTIDSLYVSRTAHTGSISVLIAKAKRLAPLLKRSIPENWMRCAAMLTIRELSPLPLLRISHKWMIFLHWHSSGEKLPS